MIKDHERPEGRAGWSARGRWLLGLTAAAVALTGCDSLLDVDVPQSITEEDFFQPYNSVALARAVAGVVECSYSRFVSGNASGNADVFTQVDDDLNDQALYDESVGGGNTCNTGGDQGYDWFEPFQTARELGQRTYDALVNDWTAAEVEPFFSVEGTFGSVQDFESIDELRAFVALYAAVPLQVYGEFLCEVSFDSGPLVAPDDVLQSAEDLVDAALDTHIPALSDANLSLPYGITSVGGVPAGASTGGYSDFAYALRARIRWAQGDLTGAALDAGMVPEGFVAYVTRGTSPDQRQNDVYVAHVEQSYNIVAGPITTVEWNPAIRTNPVTGMDWPDPIPFTGYLDLAVASDGRAIDASQYPITTATAGSTADTRVQISALGDPQKYVGLASPIPLLNWQEAWLIQAEAAAATPATAVGFVDDIRASYSLPLVSTGYNPTTADEIEDMIIEERRRSLFLEGRFWATKLHHTDKLWFPRSNGLEPAPGGEWGGAVRMVMQQQEFDLNPNVSLANRNSMCPTDQQAVEQLD
jgi:hypothetical protein